MRYNESGKATRSLWGTGTATCVLYLHICGDRIFSGKEINLDIDEPCPPELQSEAYAGKTVCCEEWTQAKQTNTPCNPLADADCDGIKNQGDTAPIAGGK